MKKARRQERQRAFHHANKEKRNAVRGILCHHCNTGLGMFRDNPTALAAAITYLGT